MRPRSPLASVGGCLAGSSGCSGRGGEDGAEGFVRVGPVGPRRWSSSVPQHGSQGDERVGKRRGGSAWIPGGSRSGWAPPPGAVGRGEAPVDLRVLRQPPLRIRMVVGASVVDHDGQLLPRAGLGHQLEEPQELRATVPWAARIGHVAGCRPPTRRTRWSCRAEGVGELGHELRVGAELGALRAPGWRAARTPTAG